MYPELHWIEYGMDVFANRTPGTTVTQITNWCKLPVVA